MRPEKCEACGGEVEFRREGSVQGYYCKHCDWAVVTTYISPIELDETKYQVRVGDANYQDEKQVKAVSFVSGLNFLQAGQLLQQKDPIVFEGEAPKVLKARDALVAVGLHCDKSPPFKY
jgi:hypothetical protein